MWIWVRERRENEKEKVIREKFNSYLKNIEVKRNSDNVFITFFFLFFFFFDEHICTGNATLIQKRGHYQ